MTNKKEDSRSPSHEPRESGVSGMDLVFVPDNGMAQIRVKTRRKFASDAKWRARWNWEPQIACETREDAVCIIAGRLRAEIARAEKELLKLRNRLYNFERREASLDPETPHSPVKQSDGERL